MARKPDHNPRQYPVLGQKLMWFKNSDNVKRVSIAFYIACGLLFVADFFYKKKAYLELEAIPASYAIFGFLTCLVVIFFAWVVRFLMMRQESYYAPKDVASEDYPQTVHGGSDD